VEEVEGESSGFADLQAMAAKAVSDTVSQVRLEGRGGDARCAEDTVGRRGAQTAQVAVLEFAACRRSQKGSLKGRMDGAAGSLAVELCVDLVMMAMGWMGWGSLGTSTWLAVCHWLAACRPGVSPRLLCTTTDPLRGFCTAQF
jgi:hypothetical protein